jgi:ubiquinol-cytochrome c reductase cytochrome b subunit
MSERQGIKNWLSSRLPFDRFLQTHYVQYHAPKNFNFWYVFGALSIVVLINQIITGIWLAMYYTPTSEGAFDSVEHIMRNVRYGWLLRYLHTTGASAFFVVTYLHMYRGLIYGSYRYPRELVWLIGMVLYFLLLFSAFSGYSLPWGQMSYWATTVIFNIFSTIPMVGQNLQLWLQGDYNVSGVTLHRMFALHTTAVPLLILGVVVLHIMALHHVGSNNPDGIDIYGHDDKQKKTKDSINFHPYYTVKDFTGVVVFLIIFASVVFYFPTMGGYFLEPANFEKADPLVTPAHIAPVWYMTPFYSILRCVPNKLMGAAAMGASIAMLFILPWLDRSPVRSIRYKGPLSKTAIASFTLSFIALGYLGTLPPEPVYIYFTRFFAVIYFLFFLLMPFYTKYESYQQPPKRISQ